MLVLPSRTSLRETAATRRGILTGGGKVVLSATAVAFLAGCTNKSSGMGMQTAEQTKSDVDILNTALGLEYEGIAAYQVGAESGLLQPDVLKLAVGFQSDHKQHAEALVKAVTQMGGMPVQPKTAAEYNFPVDTLKSQTDVLKFASGLEEGAVNAYKGAIPLFSNHDLAGAGASILGSEAMHWAILRNALGVMPPTVAFVG
jgi:rubrerythrin